MQSSVTTEVVPQTAVVRSEEIMSYRERHHQPGQTMSKANKDVQLLAKQCPWCLEEGALNDDSHCGYHQTQPATCPVLVQLISSETIVRSPLRYVSGM